MIKENNGVTLVALVITIIVLLILAGVSISLVVGDNGVLNQATNAADETSEANVESELKMAVSAVVADWTADKYVNGNTDESLDAYMTKSALEANMDTENFVITNLNVNTGSNTYTTDIEYNGKTYYFVVALTSTGNSCTVKPASASSQP